MIGAQDLVSAGYKRHLHYLGRMGDPFYQKAFCDGDVKLFFLNVFLWDLPDGNGGLLPRAEFEAPMYLSANNRTVIKVPADGWATVAEVEAFYLRAFSALGCIPDPLNND